MRPETEKLLGIAKIGAQYNFAMSGSVDPVLLAITDSGESRTTKLAASSSAEALAEQVQAVTTQAGAVAAAVVVAGADLGGRDAVLVHVQERGETSAAWVARASGRQLGPWKRAKVRALTLIAPVQ